MGSVLDAWCSQKTLQGVDSGKLSSALEAARLSYHAQAIRTMNDIAGGKWFANAFIWSPFLRQSLSGLGISEEKGAGLRDVRQNRLHS